MACCSQSSRASLDSKPSSWEVMSYLYGSKHENNGASPSYGGNPSYPLVMTNSLLLKMAHFTVDLSMKDGDFL